MLKFIISLVLILASTTSFAGKLQNSDFQSSAEITGAGGANSQLLNTSKIWDSGLAQLLDTTLTGKLNVSAFTDAAVTSKLITGFVSGAGVVAATDTILEALQKIDGNVGAAAGISELTGDVTAGPGTGSQAATIAANAVTDAKFRQSAALSLVGRSANSLGNVADIAAGADHNVMRRSGTAIGFGAIDLSQSGAVGTSILGVPNGGTGVATFTSNEPLIGNGAGAVAQGTRSGNTTVFGTTSGVLTSGDCVEFDASGNLVAAGAACGTGGGVSDGDKGDITVSGSGATWTIDNSVVTNAKMADAAAWSIKMRNAGTSGALSDAALADVTTEASPASGDFVLGYLSSGEIRKFDIGALPSSGGSASIITEWTAYSPTITSFGTTSGESFFWRRVGDSVEVRGSFTSGTHAAALGSFTLPSGLSMDTAKLAINTTTASPCDLTGYALPVGASQKLAVVACSTTSATEVYIGRALTVGSITTPNNANAYAADSQIIDVRFLVPISGWNSGYMDWTAYTPTISAGFGTPTSVSFFYRVVGDSLQVRGSFFPGTVAGTASSISLPSGFNISTSKITINDVFGSWGENIGTWGQTSTAGAGNVVTATSTSTSDVYLGGTYSTANIMLSQNVSTVLVNSAFVSLNFSVPID